jgi:TetR/AcrR family transcriptional regulator, repressor of fatR-cypB operon
VTDPNKADAILDAALALFVERGFYGTSVPSVAERAKVAAGTIYHYFDSKEALVNALYKRCKHAITAEILRDFPHLASTREQLSIVWRRMAEYALAHPKEFAFIELHFHRPYLDAESLAMESQIVEFGIAVVRQAQEQKVVKALPPELLMMFVNGAFIGVFRAALEGRLPMNLETFLTAEPCAWEAIRA